MGMRLPSISAFTHPLSTIPADRNQSELGAATGLFDIHRLSSHVDAKGCPR